LDYEFLRKLLKERSGLDLSSDKQYLVESRLTPLARRVGLSGIAELVQKIRSGTEPLTSEVVEAMTTNETFFFRDKIPFDHLRQTVLPELREPTARPCGSGARLPPPGKSPIRSRCASRNSLR
jgi:chemotaxis protein methyltransferase CheR